MKTYVVRIEIVLEEDSEEKAAKTVHSIITEPHNDLVFEVFEDSRIAGSPVLIEANYCPQEKTMKFSSLKEDP